ncbi:MAG TPA: D-2-hydroxyacid dehydrogenase family protein [Stellaceae bacterium]|nr:D-2-hydroxyacid dehydrogenase family protein [Stellaceae bacterium]
MKIVIPDDYQDIADKLPCFALIRHHQVARYADAAHDLDTLVARLGDADIIVSIRERVPLARALLERLPKLKLIALLGRTAASIDFAACTELGIPVATGASNSPDSPAEHTIALMLSARRNITREAEGMRRGALPSTVAHRLNGSTLGVFGLGAIGARVAAAGKGLGMNILVWGRENSHAKATALGYAVAASQAAFFAEADVLSLHLRLSKETRGIVGPEDLARMKPSALLVNTGRAELIEPGALLTALRHGRPGFAAVDVYEEEPVPPDHPFLSMQNVLCTPHSAWAEWENFELYFREAYEQIIAFENGAPLRLANPAVKPRAAAGKP